MAMSFKVRKIYLKQNYIKYFTHFFFGCYGHLSSSKSALPFGSVFSKFWWKTMLLHTEWTAAVLVGEQVSAVLKGGDIVWYTASDDSWFMSYRH